MILIKKKDDIPPKIKKLMKSRYIDTVNKMIDNKMSLREIKKYLDSKNYVLSINYISKYRSYRKKLGVEKVNLDKFLNDATISKIVVEPAKKTDEKDDRLKNDLEFLDMVIQTGAKGLRTQIEKNDSIITIDNVFDAIKIKDQITDSALGGMTGYGIENLTRMTEEKYMTLIRHMFDYIDQDKKDKLLKELDLVEEDFYRNTDYYKDFLRSKGLSEKQIEDKTR